MRYWNRGDELNNGKFIVEQLLGIGGFGVTYKIRHTRTKKLFALKTLNIQAQSRDDFQQLQIKFINEAIALASCCHPNIVRVYPQGFQENELWCMVMEYIEGADLAKLLDRKEKFDESKAIKIITKVGNALNFVHQQGLLHRDIKPANILLRNVDLSPVLIDFGLAREYNSGTIRSMTNSLTECYAPIEQYRSKGNFGAWTDVYALAATLYVLVTKELPIPARFRVHAELIPPQQHNSNLSDRVNRAILKGMELEPENRPQTVAEWLGLLDIQPTKILVNTTESPSLADKNEVRESLQVFEFDTVTVNDRGEIINTEHHSARYFTENLGNGVTLDMVEIPGGTFLMGSPKNEKGRRDNESPQHQVTVSIFYMAKFQVTQAQWQAVAILPEVERQLKIEPFYFKGDDLPVENVSWYDAVEFCARLSKATGKQYRLPSEAEWEYACRAGTTTPFYCGETITTNLANYRGTDWEYQGKIYSGKYANEALGEDREKIIPVGSFPPNFFGLYDMHGNVWEWCADTWHDNYQGAPTDGRAWLSENDSKCVVIHGGSWYLKPDYCRSSYRARVNPDYISNLIGFRCVMVATIK